MKRPSHLLSALASSLGLVLALTLAPAASADSPYERGPDPTRSSIEATRGPFAVTSTSVSDLSTPGFGSATVTYPTSTSEGTYGAVAISPGYTASESTIAWLGPRLASQGFVVITFNTQSRFDQPGSRGDQLLAALDYLTQRASTAIRSRIDPNRLAVIGHSMGGGGTLEAAKDRPSLKATIGLTPWNLDKTWPEIRTPSLVIGAENDSVAPTGSHAIPFYQSIPASTSKAYLELNNASHFAPNSANTTIAWSTISWLKLHVDDDTRYRQFLCPGPSPSTLGDVSDYRNTCSS
ncbi:alpha/beta hydrolase family protein [Nocardioides jishulii]|uniref:Alpha/beta hydrolase n=1 Tax=Nocardioides jishulii TaxID=2575440 RepID=A0A4U2YRG8_9ACTN|nr:dienelactone hydrolase family protein [Nocardioides jishulii]QCX26190.1 alpha/beta hydrolase [Nocardioides jishulii]TKI64009.1 alpha/beta hydrolase [Nocardioides jishulii]